MKEIIVDKALLGQYLKKYRENADYSQGEIALLLGYSSRQFVSNWERGLSTPPMNQLIRLIDLYKIPKHEFIDLMLELQKSALLKALQSV